MFKISLGIMAYNEEANIGRLLKSVSMQKFNHGKLIEIFVVASGCTDRTVEIVEAFKRQDERIRLLVQAQRKGKASAINLFLSKANGNIFILESGDTLPDAGTLDKLVAPFENSNIGMTGAHPVPVNPRNTFVGFSVQLMWLLHHKIALITPKLGELVAFRNFVKKIPDDTAVDEASIEAIVRQAGYELCYVSDAIVRNKGPDNIRDFIKQRRRIAAGHKRLVREQKHEVSTLDPKKILRILIRKYSWNSKDMIWIFGTILLEVIGRMLGYYDFYLKKKNPFIWDVAWSTKKLS